jgi:hypothetical protein
VPLCHSAISMSAGRSLQVDLLKSSARTSGSLCPMRENDGAPLSLPLAKPFARAG